MNKYAKALTFFAVALLTTTLFAQGVPDDPDLQAQVPVDGGIFTVVGSSIAYGVYRLRNRKK
ncbi:MAG: hypothetical protein NBV77_05275 [Bacteroidia bacterium]|nr:hypothetical protein [Bacteroidia bacterium]